MKLYDTLLNIERRQPGMMIYIGMDQGSGFVAVASCNDLLRAGKLDKFSDEVLGNLISIAAKAENRELAGMKERLDKKELDRLKQRRQDTEKTLANFIPLKDRETVEIYRRITDGVAVIVRGTERGSY